MMSVWVFSWRNPVLALNSRHIKAVTYFPSEVSWWTKIGWSQWAVFCVCAQCFEFHSVIYTVVWVSGRAVSRPVKTLSSRPATWYSEIVERQFANLCSSGRKNGAKTCSNLWVLASFSFQFLFSRFSWLSGSGHTPKKNIPEYLKPLFYKRILFMSSSQQYQSTEAKQTRSVREVMHWTSLFRGPPADSREKGRGICSLHPSCPDRNLKL